jgi:hypothetical protein
VHFPTELVVKSWVAEDARTGAVALADALAAYAG